MQAQSLHYGVGQQANCVRHTRMQEDNRRNGDHGGRIPWLQSAMV